MILHPKGPIFVMTNVKDGKIEDAGSLAKVARARFWKNQGCILSFNQLILVMKVDDGCKRVVDAPPDLCYRCGYYQETIMISESVGAQRKGSSFSGSRNSRNSIEVGEPKLPSVAVHSLNYLVFCIRQSE
ncbi:hypothetical protein HPP92_028847 [Vanilla planifolia]|uniref:Uncharacterized protein n=1 Tax=Vanilla planifolia TaxID=51239 RepID=A0A835U3G9_VANPL|nr:hypothetical protein HPP92_028847 [Vanilla planifolia]KAG0446419.1 hypothetical protein HPP92_028836 [Vanilla planifolia]